MRLADSTDTSSDDGRRVVVPEDVDEAAEVLAALHGGSRRAAAWLRTVLRQLDGRTS